MTDEQEIVIKVRAAIHNLNWTLVDALHAGLSVKLHIVTNAAEIMPDHLPKLDVVELLSVNPLKDD